MSPASEPTAVEPGASLARPVLRNLGALLGGRGLGLALHFVAFALAAAHLGPARVGVYALALALAALFRLVPAFAFDPIVVRDVVGAPEREARLVPTVAYLRLALGVVAYGLLAGTAVALGYTGEQRTAALIAGLTLLLVWVETFRNSLSIRYRLGWAAVADALDGSLMLAGSIALVLREAGVLAFVVLYVAVKAVNVTIVLLAAVTRTRFSWQPQRSLVRGAITAAAPIALASLLITAYYRLDIVVLAQLQPIADVGQYGTGYRFYETALVAAAILSTVLQPLLARSHLQGRDVLERRYAQAMRLVATIALPIAVIGAMTAWRVVPAVPGLEQFDGAGVALSILAPGIVFTYAATVTQVVLMTAHVERRLVAVSAAALALNVVLIAVLIPTLSYVGAAVATTLTEAAVLALSVRELRRRLGVRPRVERIERVAATTVAAAAVVALGYAVHPFAQLALGVIAYVIALFATRALSRAELRTLLAERP